MKPQTNQRDMQSKSREDKVHCDSKKNLKFLHQKILHWETELSQAHHNLNKMDQY